MKILSVRETKSMSSPSLIRDVRNAFRRLKVGQSVVIEAREWKEDKHPSQIFGFKGASYRKVDGDYLIIKK